MPAARSAVNADGGAWKVKLLFSGVPPTAMAVSRLTIIRSGAARPAAAGPNTVAGFAANRLAVRSVKWTSPAKPSLTTPMGSEGVAELAEDEPPEAEPGAEPNGEPDRSVLAPVERAGDGEDEPSHPASS